MKRLFYFTGYRLIVSHWKGKERIGLSSFEPTEKGLFEFRAYLEQTENIPAKFLVDVIEEDFRNEKVPHVGNKDRQAVINRLIDRYFRASNSYCYSEVIGREKSGRKDDVVLLGAVTNPQLIEPWLTIIDECEVPLSGIWSLPLISKQLLKTLKATTGVVLLVSQQVNSNVRQSLFRDGKLISSRQSIINQNIDDITGIGSLAEPEVGRTIHFLRAQNMISMNEVINLHVIGAAQQQESLNKSFKSNEQQTVKVHNIDDITEKLGLKNVNRDFSDSIFSWLCLNNNFLSSHYGGAHLFNRFHNKLAASFLYAASLLVVITGALFTQANISDAIEMDKSVALLREEENNYKKLYSAKFKDFEEVFQNAGVMNAAVDLSEQIKINSMTSPLDFLIVLSEVVSQDGVGALHIDKIEWRAININERSKEEEIVNYTAKAAALHSAIVSGRIDESEDNYRQSVNRINRIIDRLRAEQRIESVETISLPVDTRSDSKFATESGLNASIRKKSATGLFSLKIIMRAPDNV